MMLRKIFRANRLSKIELKGVALSQNGNILPYKNEFDERRAETWAMINQICRSNFEMEIIRILSGERAYKNNLYREFSCDKFVAFTTATANSIFDEIL